MKNKERNEAILYLIIGIAIFGLLFFLKPFGQNVIGVGYETAQECADAKVYYQFCGCGCPAEGYDCQFVEGAGYVLHCDNCPSTFDECNAAWANQTTTTTILETTTTTLEDIVTTTTTTSTTTTTINPCAGTVGALKCNPVIILAIVALLGSTVYFAVKK